MAILQQGDSYQPSDSTEQFISNGEIEDGESSQEQAPQNNDETVSNKNVVPEFLANNKKKFIIGGVAAILVIVLILVFVLILNEGEGSKDDLPDFVTEDDIENPTEPEEFKYTDEQKELLRSYGFTGTDIENFEHDQFDPNEAVKRVIALRKEAEANIWKEFYAGRGKKFKRLENLTYFGNKPRKVPKGTVDSTYYEQLNVDYEKVPLYGGQCFLKVILKDRGTNAFMCIEPDRWRQLKKKGNIVVGITYSFIKKKAFITNIVEIRTEAE
jgi:hypothetical protein